MRAQGIDVSKWEGNVNYSKAFSKGAAFVYIKASQQSADPTFATNWKNARGILPRGAYHYLDFSVDEIKQATLFCSLIANDHGELPPCVDYEQDDNGKAFPALTRDIRVQKLYNFLQYVEKTLNVVPAIYSGYYYWGSWGNTKPLFARYPLWLPWYAPESVVKVPAPWKKWTFWQYTDRADGKAYGCDSLEVDANWFNGTQEELRAFIAGNPTYKTCPTCLGTGKVLA